jgi:predicted alpha/beta-fold hydrolase
MSEVFRPPRWAAGPHAQTLMARVLRPDGGPDVERERLTTPDGDFLDIDWGPDPGPDAPIVLILHGLEGSSLRRYVRSVARALLVRGVRPVALNFRGCSGEPNRALRFYHSGETSDPSLVLAELRRRFPGRRLGAMGFSLGGNVLLKLMGEREDGGTGVLDAAAVMSVPYDLAAGCRLLERSLMGRAYAAYFLRLLKRKVALKAPELAEAVDIRAARRAGTIWSFDDVVTAPLHGFRGAADYYARSSSACFLATVGVPTLLVHAMDDPFLPPDAIPVRDAQANPHLTLSLSPGGGHVGFVEGTPWRPGFWADERVAAFIADRLQDSSVAASDRRTDSERNVP